MNLSFALPAYCERLGDGLWAEPLNAVSNAAFFIAAYVGWRIWKQRGGADRAAPWLIFSAALVGAGSLAWHTWRTQETLIADIVPIQIFVFGYFTLALRRFLKLDLIRTAATLAAFVALTILCRRLVPVTVLAGGANYVPALLALYLLGTVLVIRSRLALHADVSLTGQAAARSDAAHFPGLKAGYGLLLAGLIFALSLVARTLDLPFCQSLPTGLHFLWHSLNGVAIGVLLATAIRHGPGATAQ